MKHKYEISISAAETEENTSINHHPSMARLSSSLPLCLCLVFAVALLAMHTAQAGGGRSLHKEDCPAACDYRCSATSHRKPCLFYCNKCCETCLCVPSGTYGNKEECPCYNNWKTKEGGPKCP